MALRRLALIAALGISVGGCGWLTGAPAAVVPLPTLTLDLGTVPVGDNKETRVRVPATEAQRAAFDGGHVQVHANNILVSWAGSGSGYLDLVVTTNRIRECEAFSTTAGVERNGVTVMDLEIKAKVRRAFEVKPLLEGKRYELLLAPGIALPEAIDCSSGLEAEIRSIGTSRAEVVLTRTAPALVPGGSVRLIDRASGDTRVIVLPVTGDVVQTTSMRMGTLVGNDHKLTIGANSALTPDKPGVEVVIDPPGAYRVTQRQYTSGKFTVTLRSGTRHPVDAAVGFRRKGRWMEIQRLFPSDRNR